MKLRTTFEIEPSDYRISYDDPVMFIGSCFSSYIGSCMSEGHMPVMINPAGTVYNPASVSNTLDILLSSREFTGDDLVFHNGLWHSFSHYSDYSGDDQSQVLEKINTSAAKASEFLCKARFLFITFGTARVFSYKKTGLIVSNCHKLPASEFENHLLSVDDIVDEWMRQLDRLGTRFPDLKVILTISPVRHWKDGAHGNQVSKSVLFLAVEELLNNRTGLQYFPAYELVMDDLRDYRFYADDMLHPSDIAVDYIWDAFSKCYLDSSTASLWHDVVKITKSTRHRFITGSMQMKKEFASGMLKQIEHILAINPRIDLSGEENYFRNILK